MIITYQTTNDLWLCRGTILIIMISLFMIIMIVSSNKIMIIKYQEMIDCYCIMLKSWIIIVLRNDE